MSEIERMPDDNHYQEQTEVNARQSFEIIEATDHPDFDEYPEGVKLIVFDGEFDEAEMYREPVPVFDSRDDSHHELIAKHYSEKMGVVHGVGLYGAVWPVKSSDSVNAIERFKPDKPEWEKVPVYILPQDLEKVIDREQIHEEFRPYFQNEQTIKTLYEAAPAIHLIVPVEAGSTDISPVFITYPEDWDKKGASREQHIKVPTISAFYWDDPDHERIASKTKEFLHDGHIAISSFNRHGEQPAWDFEGLLEYIERNDCPFDYIVYDPLLDKISVGSSFVQIAPPLQDEDPCWKVYRTGPTAIDKYLERIKSEHGYKVVEGAKKAARKPELEDEDLDGAMLAARDAVLRTTRQQRSNVNDH